MNNRFKFRFWDKKEKEYFTCGEIDYKSRIPKTYPYRTYNWCFEHKNIIAEQCTGLKDKNGNLIYEGDILGGIYGGYISWCDECKSFELFFPEFGCASCNGDVLWQEIVQDDGILEILGNIHENADLLEN